MYHRFFLMLSFFIVLTACGGGADTKKSDSHANAKKSDSQADTQTGDDQKAIAMAGYQLPDSIEVLEAQE